MVKPVLSIIIVSFNTEELTRQCLTSLFQADKRLDFSGKPQGEEKIPAEIIVVDNNSTDGTRRYLFSLKKKIPSLRLLLNPENVGFGRANNQAMKVARGEYFLLLNSDTIIPEAAISQTLLWLSSHPEVDLVGCKLLNKDGSLQLSAGRFPTLGRVFLTLFLDHFLRNKAMMFSPAKICFVDWVMGAFMLLRRDVFRQTGGFDEKIFMYTEELEWCFRIKKAGFQIAFYPNAKIIHLGGGSSGGKKTNSIINIYRGFVYFYRKHYSPFSLVVLKLMLKVKAKLAILIGKIFANEYLVETYQKALAVIK